MKVGLKSALSVTVVMLMIMTAFTVLAVDAQAANSQQTTAAPNIVPVLQDKLTISTNYGFTSPSMGSHYYRIGSPVFIWATPPMASFGVRYIFNGWIGYGIGSYTGHNNPALITMKSSITERASWTVQYWVAFKEIGLSPAAGLRTVLTVGYTAYNQYNLPTGMWVNAGTTFSWSWVVSGGLGTQFVKTGDIGLTSPIYRWGTDTAVYKTQYLLTVRESGLPVGVRANVYAGFIHGSTGYIVPFTTWITAGTQTGFIGVDPTVYGAFGARYVFTGWFGDGFINPHYSLVMNHPMTLTADYRLVI